MARRRREVARSSSRYTPNLSLVSLYRVTRVLELTRSCQAQPNLTLPRILNTFSVEVSLCAFLRVKVYIHSTPTTHRSLRSLTRHCHAMSQTNTHPQRWPRAKTTTTLKPNTTYWDHPNPSQSDYLTPLTRVLTTPDHIPPNYRPSPADWTRIPWVHNQQAST